MANILFAANEPGSVVVSTTPGPNYHFGTTPERVYDAKYSPRGEFHLFNGASVSCYFSEPVTLGENVWFHFRSYIGGRNNSSYLSSGSVFGIFTSLYPAAKVFQLRIEPGSTGKAPFPIIMQKATDLIGGAASISETQNIISPMSTAVWDINLKLDSVLGYVLVFMNGGLFMSYFGDTTSAGAFTHLSGFFVRGPGSTFDLGSNPYGHGISCAFSELLAARQRTLGQRVISYYPVGNGEVMDWTGSYSNISGVYPNDGSAVTTDNADEDALFDMNATDGSLDPTLRLAGVVTSARMYADGIGSVQRVAHLLKLGDTAATLRVGGTQALAPEHPMTYQEWATNPETGEKFLLGDLDDIQVGLRSRV